jgi:hypothetical protein
MKKEDMKKKNDSKMLEYVKVFFFFVMRKGENVIALEPVHIIIKAFQKPTKICCKWESYY